MAKAKKITTTIRWEGADLEEVKSAAHRIGLPVALFVKSIVLAKVRNAEGYIDFGLKKDLLQAKKDLQSGDFEVFTSKKALLDDLKSYID